MRAHLAVVINYFPGVKRGKLLTVSSAMWLVKDYGEMLHSFLANIIIKKHKCKLSILVCNAFINDKMVTFMDGHYF